MNGARYHDLGVFITGNAKLGNFDQLQVVPLEIAVTSQQRKALELNGKFTAGFSAGSYLFDLSKFKLDRQLVESAAG